MTKADLKTGMVVTCRNTRKFMIMKGLTTGYPNNLREENHLVGVDIKNSGFIRLDESWNNDLTYPTDSQWDIVRVGVADYNGEIRGLFVGLPHTPIWTRPEKKKYTYAQLKEILGDEFEIVKE